MAALADADLLAAWEIAHARPRTLQSAALLALADPRSGEATLAALPLGEAARRVLELQADWFEPTLRCACECPACGEGVEADCDALALRAAAPHPGAIQTALRVDQSGYSVSLRPPTALDLAHAAGAAEVAGARGRLLQRCVLDATHDGEPCAPGELPHAVTLAIADALEHADPLADIGLALQCPACGSAWTAALDPTRFLLASLDQAARRVMVEVHLLARAYGWSEAQTLSLGRARRRAYIELADA